MPRLIWYHSSNETSWLSPRTSVHLQNNTIQPKSGNALHKQQSASVLLPPVLNRLNPFLAKAAGAELQIPEGKHSQHKHSNYCKMFQCIVISINTACCQNSYENQSEVDAVLPHLQHRSSRPGLTWGMFCRECRKTWRNTCRPWCRSVLRLV